MHTYRNHRKSDRLTPMEIIRGLHNIRPRHAGCVATIGTFDGVHHGHQMLLAHLVAKSHELGQPSVLARRLVRVTQECLYKGIEQVRPGAFLGDIGAAIQRHAEAQRFTVVREFGGHGIGRIFHDEPLVLHYGERGTGVRLEPGMTFTIEPMINAGKRNVKMLPDKWTVVTKDHRLSAQWEHTVLVTDDGVEVLTRRAEESALAPAAA